MHLLVCPTLLSSDTKWALGSFIGGAVVFVFGLPFMFVSGSSLYSKFIPSSIQGVLGCAVCGGVGTWPCMYSVMRVHVPTLYTYISHTVNAAQPLLYVPVTSMRKSRSTGSLAYLPPVLSVSLQPTRCNIAISQVTYEGALYCGPHVCYPLTGWLLYTNILNIYA